MEPLEHSVLNEALDNSIAEVHGEPMFGSDSRQTFMKLPDAMRNVALRLGMAVSLLPGDVGRVALSTAEVCLSVSNICVNNINTEGFQRWNTDRDILDQYETFSGLSVYYGGDLCDSEDSERDDPYALASAAYVEDYNFDVPEGMDLMVHRRSKISDGSETQRDDQTDMVPVCQMVSCVTRNGWDAFNDDSWTEATDVDGPNTDDFYQWAVSSDEEDFVISDVGSIADFNWNMSEEEELMNSDDGSVVDFDSDNSDVNFCCDSDVGSVADLEWDTWGRRMCFGLSGCSGCVSAGDGCDPAGGGVQGHLICGEECDTAFTDGWIASISSVTNRHVGQTSSEYLGRDPYYV